MGEAETRESLDVYRAAQLVQAAPKQEDTLSQIQGTVNETLSSNLHIRTITNLLFLSYTKPREMGRENKTTLKKNKTSMQV